MQHVEVLVDGGATLPAVGFREGVDIPTSPVITAASVSGAQLVQPVAEPAHFSAAGSDVQRPYHHRGLSCELVGRDVLCKLNASIHCTPDGLHLTVPDHKAIQALQRLRTASDTLLLDTP